MHAGELQPLPDGRGSEGVGQRLMGALLFLAAGVVVAGWLFAQAPQNPAQSDITPQAGDPPARVARLNWVAGDVSFQPAGLEDWTDATVNFPVTTGDHLVTGQDSRAEMHVGPNAIRLRMTRPTSLHAGSSPTPSSFVKGHSNHWKSSCPTAP